MARFAQAHQAEQLPLQKTWTRRVTPQPEFRRRKPRRDLPRLRTLNAFYAYHFIFLPDILLGRLTRPGPLGFFHSYGRYRDFSRLLVLSDSLDVVVRTEHPRKALEAVFGKPFSNKVAWPP